MLRINAGQVCSAALGLQRAQLALRSRVLLPWTKHTWKDGEHA
jgi:hypothetical protein